VTLVTVIILTQSIGNQNESLLFPAGSISSALNIGQKNFLLMWVILLGFFLLFVLRGVPAF